MRHSCSAAARSCSRRARVRPRWREASPDMDDRPSSGISDGAVIPDLPA